MSWERKKGPLILPVGQNPEFYLFGGAAASRVAPPASWIMRP